MSFVDDAIWNKFPGNSSKYSPEMLPKVSIIVPTSNCAQSISLTLESILNQNYPHFEIIIVDSGSTDSTLEIVKSIQDPRIKIQSVNIIRRYEMLNEGIALSSGKYLNFLFPADFYIHPNTLLGMMTLALAHDLPHLVYCGCLLRDGKTEVKVLYRELNLTILKKGQQPTSLQSCWFRADLFREIGEFRIDYELRGGFDLLCRFCLNGHLQTASTQRVFTDYDLRGYTKRMVIKHFWDTMRGIYRHFGMIVTLRWIMSQKDWKRYMKLSMRSLKIAFKPSSI